MKHAAHVRMTHDDVHGVAVCLALVDDHGKLQRLGQLKLLLKGDDLLRTRHVLIMIVQPDLTDCHHLVHMG